MGRNGKGWSREEVHTLVKNYRRLTMAALMELLPGRTRGAIRKKAMYRHIRRQRTQEEWYDLIRENEGASITLLSDIAMCSWNTAAKWLRRYKTTIQ